MQGEVVTMAGIKYYFPGMTLMAMGIIIVAFPEVLVAMVAAAIIFAGAVTLYIGHMIRKGFDDQSDIHGSALDTFPMDEPLFRRWQGKF